MNSKTSIREYFHSSNTSNQVSMLNWILKTCHTAQEKGGGGGGGGGGGFWAGY